MKRVVSLSYPLLLVVLLLAAADSSIGTGEFLIARRTAGRIQEGMTLDAVLTKYEGQAKLVDGQLEGEVFPWIEIYLDPDQPEVPSLVVEISTRKLVYRTNVYDKRFRTVTGIGVGSTLGDVRKNYILDGIFYGEGSLFARVNEIGVSFKLDIRVSELPASWSESRDMDLVPDSTKIVSILIVG